MALTADVRSVDGESAGSVSLDESIFGIQPNVPVMHQVVVAQLAAARAGTQSTKTRAEVSGGGKKPFKQKGTGRARQGSERAPHFTGGGIALGPKPRSYRQRTPRKMVQLALRSALSDRASEGRILVVDSWPWAEPSTASAKAALTALGLSGRVLVVLSRSDQEAYKSFRNLVEVQLMLEGELNAYDILCNEWIVFTRQTLPGSSAPVDGAPVDGAPAGSEEPVSAAEAVADDPAGSDGPAGSDEPADASADEADGEEESDDE